MSKATLGSRPLLRFFGCFTLLYLLLLLPWPGVDGFFGGYLREIGRILFEEQRGDRVLDFLPSMVPGASAGSTEIVVANQTLLRQDGSRYALAIEFDARDVLLKPFALMLALSMATPMHFRRRLGSFLLGTVLLHCYVCLCLEIFICLQSSELSLMTLGPWSKQVLASTGNILIDQLSFGAPLLIWVLVTFRNQDLANILKARVSLEKEQMISGQD